MRHFPVFAGMLSATLMAACSGGSTGTTQVLTKCDSTTTTTATLAVGEYRIVDPLRESPCVRLPGNVAAQEYVVWAYSGQGTDAGPGVTGSFAILANSSTSVSGSVASNRGIALQEITRGQTGASFDRMLRLRERDLLSNPALRSALLGSPPVLGVPPVVGQKDSFFVCGNLSCSSFNKIGATVAYVGSAGVVYLDDHTIAGAEVLTQADLIQLGTLFDNYLYAADTTNFGRESDINGDQHVSIVITPAVNALTPDCTNGRVIGYFFGNDLLPGASGSNNREMFYATATSVATANCSALGRARALSLLPPTLIHEFQHMISFNQHVLLRAGSDQVLWVNEGLSHFAEELGYRVVPDAQCPNAASCFSEFASGDLFNAFDYLDNTEATFLVAPRDSDDALTQRGAAWLFLRWAADNFSADTLLGTQFTRGLEQSTVVGAARISQLTGLDFATLVGEWGLANWTDNLVGFPQTSRLRYKTWNFRDVFGRNYPAVWNKPYPLTPDSTTGSYSHSGTLRGGSGKMVRFQLPAGSTGVTVQLAGGTTGTAIASVLEARIAVVRVK